jgi:hypothetical protein
VAHLACSSSSRTAVSFNQYMFESVVTPMLIDLCCLATAAVLFPRAHDDCSRGGEHGSAGAVAVGVDDNRQ